MKNYQVISADSHVLEPPEMWGQRIEKRFRDRAPRVTTYPNGTAGEFFVCENVGPLPVANFFGVGVKVEDFPEHRRSGFEAAPGRLADPAARVADQQLDGVEAEVLYASMGLALYLLDDAELRAACFRAYNDWLTDYCSHDPCRLVGLGLITLEDVSAAVGELERVARRGVRGVIIWDSPPEEKPYRHPDYDPFWAAAAHLRLPVSLHSFTRPGGATAGFDFLVNSVADMNQEVRRALTNFVLGGVLERFPDLKLVSAENDVSWLPHFIWLLDSSRKRLRHFQKELPLLPSDYMQRQVFATLIDEPPVFDLLRWYGPDNLMWSSDYPHPSSPWPDSRRLIDKIFHAMPEEVAGKIVSRTVRSVYNLD